ncbi:MAG: radical SAM protein [Deltaproteobacteria bacterium]|nr:radical SAM protein [Deltaproteobacteria bacterium]
MTSAQSVPFAARLRAKMGAWAQALAPLPHGYAFAALDLDQGISFELRGADGPLWIEADLAPGPGFARTRSLRLCHQPHALTARQRQVVDVAVQRFQALDDGDWPTAGAEEPAVRHVRADRVLVTGPNLPTDYAINPYVGCTIGCAFCNARFRAEDVRRLDGRPHRPWGAWIDAKVDAAEVLAREVASARPGSVCFSPVITDPYVPIEAKLGITRGCLQVLAAARFSAAVLTRSAWVRRDFDVLRQMPAAAVGVSLPTEDEEWLQAMEPRGATLAERLAVLDDARARGLRTFAVVQPAYPRDPAALAALLAARVDAVRVDGLYEVDRVGHLFLGVALADPPAVEAEFARLGVPTDLAEVLHHRS